MKKFGALSLLAAILVGAAARADQPATHGMLLFGEKSTYASHLPMFHSPHDYQLIMKLKLADVPRSITLMKYRAAKQQSQAYFTLVPEPMDLTKVASGALKSFVATIYEGHFERAGKPIGPIQVTVEELIYAQKLDGAQAPSANGYLVFGSDSEYFAAHLIHGKPNFDAITSTSQPYRLVDAPCRTRACLAPKKVAVSDDKLPLVLSGSPDLKPPRSGDALGALGGEIADIKQVIYVEEGELSFD